jgi:hypothetical protein
MTFELVSWGVVWAASEPLTIEDRITDCPVQAFPSEQPHPLTCSLGIVSALDDELQKDAGPVIYSRCFEAGAVGSGWACVQLDNISLMILQQQTIDGSLPSSG